MSNRKPDAHRKAGHSAFLEPSRNPSISGIPPLPVSKFADMSLNQNNQIKADLNNYQTFSRSQSSLHSSGSGSASAHSSSLNSSSNSSNAAQQHHLNNSAEYTSKNSQLSIQPQSRQHQLNPQQQAAAYHSQQQQQLPHKQYQQQQQPYSQPQVPQSRQPAASPVRDQPHSHPNHLQHSQLHNHHPEQSQSQPQSQSQSQSQIRQVSTQRMASGSSAHSYAQRAIPINQQMSQQQIPHPQAQYHRQYVNHPSSQQQYMEQQQQQQQQQQQYRDHQQRMHNPMSQQQQTMKRQVSHDINRQREQHPVAQRSVSESHTPTTGYGQQMQPQGVQYNNGIHAKAPVLPNLNLNHGQESLDISNNSNNSLPRQGSQSSNKSPILRQSLSFIRSGGKSTSPMTNSSPEFVSDANNSRSNSTRGSNFGKYHMNNNKNVTMNGRVIPQKLDIANVTSTNYQQPHSTLSASSSSSTDFSQGSPTQDQDEFPPSSQHNVPKKSRSFSSLTRRAVSTSSLSSNLANSSNNINGMSQRVTSNSSMISKNFLSSSIKRPNVYPAMLSRVARAFEECIQTGSKFKNGLEYRDSFTGAEAVDVICRIIKTSDRNLALLLGRSLDAQKLFHDVTYEHRLRDSNNEVYQFSGDIMDPYTLIDSSTNRNGNTERHGSVASESTLNFDTSSLNSPITNGGGLMHSNSVSTTATLTNSRTIMNSDSVNGNVSNNTGGSTSVPVVGVFTLLTDCYSPTCSRDSLCYSIACPRRLEQQARLNMKPQGGLSRSDSHLSLSGQEEQKAFWSLTVPKTVLESMDKREIKRQECIFETIYSERDFVKDLEYLREFWLKPLSETKIIKESEREYFVNAVFYGINEIWEINSKFAEALTKRQQEQSVVKEIGDLFLEYIPKFEPFIKYGAGQVMGKYEFDRQKRHNAFFVRFIEDTNNRVESRRLDVSSYLSKPTSRPARYPLLLKSIRDHTDPNSKDYENLNTAIQMLQKMLTRINFETGKASDRLNLFLLKQKLFFRPGELVDLKLTSEHRKLLYQCVLKKRNYQDKDKQGEVHVYLFDHALLFVKIKIINKREIYRVYQRPIPLPLLFVTLSEESPNLKMIKKSASTSNLIGSASTLLMNSSTQSMQSFLLASTAAKSPISFFYLGRNGYDMTLYATNAVQRILIDKLEAQTKKLIEDNDVFTLTPLSSKFFDNSNKINCVVPFDGGRKLLYGTDAGIYTSDVKLTDNGRIVSRPVKIILKYNVIQVEILDEYQMVLALSDKKLFYWPIDVLQQQAPDASKNAKLGKELMTHVSFFKIGVCGGRMLVCAAKSSANLIRIFEPIDPIQQRKTKRKFDVNTKDVSFTSEPVSISFLKTKLCVGCSKGFEIVSLETGAMEQLLDPADTALDFALGKEGLKPLEIDRINSDLLLSYSSFSFFIDHNGWRARPKWIIHWEGVPHSFALWYPYLLAFDSGFIEIRHVESGELLRTIIAENIRFLHSSSQEILYAYEDEHGYDVVASLDFWDKTKKNKSKAVAAAAAAASIAEVPHES